MFSSLRFVPQFVSRRSKVTDPKNIVLVGIPPKALIEDIAQALIRNGINVDNYFKTACSVTKEWIYDDSHIKVTARIRQKFSNEQFVPLKSKTLSEILNPQPAAAIVIKKLLDWIDRCDIASQTGAPKPPFETEDGQPIFPEDDDPWWLSEIQKRKVEENEEEVVGDEDGPASDVEEQQAEVSDEDPVSETEDGPAAHDQQQQQQQQPRAHVPRVAWRM